MSKQPKASRRDNHVQPRPKKRASSTLLIALALAGVAGAVTLVQWQRPPAASIPAQSNSPVLHPNPPAASISTGAPPIAPINAVAAAGSGSPAAPTNALPQMEVKQAVMVTVDLDLGGNIHSVADALREVERRHQPTDGTGRVFAILDAYRNPTPDDRKLRVSMHVSTEKIGIGSLVLRRTGEVLWSSRIVPAADGTSSTQPNGLTILIDDGAGHTPMVDGSSNPATILEAQLKEPGIPVSVAWPDGAEREVTFLYSACGCPVKVMCRREGNRTVRTKDEPVIFPDDPAVLDVIRRLMAW